LSTDVRLLRFAVQLLRQLDQRTRDRLQPGCDHVLLLTLAQSRLGVVHAREAKNNGFDPGQFLQSESQSTNSDTFMTQLACA
jgi:hypothetical protein